MAFSTFEKEMMMSNILKDLGVDPALRGYKYIIDAVIFIDNDPEMSECITKKLYPAIAEKNHTTSTRVERCIRHSIEKCFNETALEVKAKYFGNCMSLNTGKVTNNTFIAVMVEALQSTVKRGGIRNGSNP